MRVLSSLTIACHDWKKKKKKKKKRTFLTKKFQLKHIDGWIFWQAKVCWKRTASASPCLFLCRKVLKEISVGELQPDETVDAVREARVLSRLHHPSIVKFHDSFVDGEFFCIITEFCDVSVTLWNWKTKNKKHKQCQQYLGQSLQNNI